jgi:hypothetical protein
VEWSGELDESFRIVTYVTSHNGAVRQNRSYSLTESFRQVYRV